ncbi:MAG: hypothetical protein AAGH92_07635 [Planctomycetota bacterium]
MLTPNHDQLIAERISSKRSERMPRKKVRALPNPLEIVLRTIADRLEVHGPTHVTNPDFGLSDPIAEIGRGKNRLPGPVTAYRGPVFAFDLDDVDIAIGCRSFRLNPDSAVWRRS